MADEPMIKLEPGGTATILSYNVPEPTSYSGRNFIELDVPDDHFKPEVKRRPPQDERTPPSELSTPTLGVAVAEAMRNGFADSRLFPNVRTTATVLRFVPSTNPGMTIVSDFPVSAKLRALSPDEATTMLQQGRRLNVYRSLFGELTYRYVPEPPAPRPRILLVETVRLSSFLGSYGAGRVLKTFSLLPGERTKISVKSYTKRETEAKQASSILDSFTQESASEFETSIQREQSSKETYEQSFEYHAEAEAEAGWGWGSAKVSGGVKGGTNSAREESSKNVSSAASKQAQKASAKRDVQINTSYEVKEETGEESSIEREVQNVNLSRTLNFVFRQMNQEFITLLHLTDVRIAFFNGYAESRREVALPDLDSLIDDVIVDDAAKRQAVRDMVIGELETVFDYRDDLRSIVEDRQLLDAGGNPLGARYHRVKKDIVSSYTDPVTGAKFEVPGILLSAQKLVLRTEGVIVEALLGQGEALDAYAKRLQNLEVVRREAEVGTVAAERDRADLLNQVVANGDAQKAKLLVDLTCPCGREGPHKLAEHEGDEG